MYGICLFAGFFLGVIVAFLAGSYLTRTAQKKQNQPEAPPAEQDGFDKDNRSAKILKAVEDYNWRDAR